MKRHMTLAQIEGDDWGPSPYDSHVVTECHRLRHVPLRDLTVENLRLLIGQDWAQHRSLAVVWQSVSRRVKRRFILLRPSHAENVQG